jgi:hypothetical protein
MGRDPRQSLGEDGYQLPGTWTYLSGSLKFPEVPQSQVEASQHSTHSEPAVVFPRHDAFIRVSLGAPNEMPQFLQVWDRLPNTEMRMGRLELLTETL